MTQGTNQSYLDLSVHPLLASRVLSNSPSVVFTNDLDAIVWANAPGAALFGGKGIIELLEANLSENQTFVRQLKNAVVQMNGGDKITRGFRINQGLRSALLQFEILKIGLGPGILGYLVGCEPLESTTPTELVLAANCVSSLENFADASAIVDDFGLPIASSSSFGRMGPSEGDLLALIKELAGENDNLIKRPIYGANGRQIIAGLGRFDSDLGRTLVVLAEVPQEQAALPDVPELKLIDGDEPVREPQGDAISQEDTPSVVVEKIPDDHPVVTPPQDDTESEARRVAEASQSSTSQPTPAEDEATPPPSSSEGEDLVRFAWTTNSEGHFTHVSDELVGIVGPNSASVLGNSWSDLQQRLGLDPHNEVKSVMDGHDTWSGKTVLWPIEGTDMAVPIDLAALPTFTAERAFDGFKGFGIIRTLDAIVDPEAYGMKLNDTPQHSTESPDIIKLDQSETSEDDDEQDVPIKISAKKSNDTSKSGSSAEVVRLVPKAPADTSEQENQLSPAEDSAFKKIAETLKNTGVSQAREQKQADTSLIEKLPIAVLVYRDGRPLFANAKFLEVSGYADLSELIDIGGFDSLFDLDEHNGSNGSGLIAKTGEILPISPVLHTVRWAGEKALQLSFAPPNLVSPVNEPPALEMTQVSEIQSILDTTSDGIILLRSDGEILSVNASAEALFNTSFDDAVGNNIRHLFAAESQADIDEYIESLSQPGIQGIFQKGLETIGKVGDEGIIPIYLTVARLETTGKLCAVVRDLSTWKKTEEELILSKKSAERANAEKTEFLAKVSHEIRTPLNAIIGFSELMIEQRFGPIENRRYREYLNDINRSGRHVLELVNDLLDLSKVESGNLEMNFEAVELNSIVTECVALMQPTANANRIIIRTSLSRTVPKVVADKRSIKQIIINLLSNAVKYSPSSSQVIVSTVYENSGEVALRVRDAGSGMDGEELKNAMKPYTQVHRTSETTTEGTGLGLPLTKALVEANRALFDLESEPGIGTIAHINFPVQRVLVD